MSTLDDLKKMTTVVADTGEIQEIKKYEPTDATTNPSLILKACGLKEYQPLIKDAIMCGTSKEGKTDLDSIMNRIFVNFGVEILKIVPARVSTEVDARLSFDVEGSIKKAHEYIDLYQKAGIDKNRVLIKLASTWEGILAAKQLEKEGIHCNMTLMFCLAQAIACAEAGVTLISPFVGRIFDWYKKAEGRDGYPPDQDPGVVSVRQIFNYYKKFGYKTEIMGASFRNVDQITHLSGCDLLTISPQLLKELSDSEAPLDRALSAEQAGQLEIEKVAMNEKRFRYLLNEDRMATEKLAEGIRGFAQDTVKLEKLIQTLL